MVSSGINIPLMAQKMVMSGGWVGWLMRKIREENWGGGVGGDGRKWVKAKWYMVNCCYFRALFVGAPHILSFVLFNALHNIRLGEGV